MDVAVNAEHVEIIEQKSESADGDSFCLKFVFECFTRCYENELDLAVYIEAYKNLNKLFHKLGGLFKFIIHDISDKIQILEEHLKSDVGHNYAKIEGMLIYERDTKLIDNPALIYSNGSRTLLRLHRSLLFIVKLIGRVRTSSDEEKIAPLAKNAYDTTLGHYHPWLIRKGVHLAVYTLPTRKQFITDIAGSTMACHEADQLMAKTVDIGQRLYDAVEKLYLDYNLIHLP